MFVTKLHARRHYETRINQLTSTILFFVFFVGMGILNAQVHVQSRAGKAGAINQGKQLFESYCAVCHGIDGGGGKGPALTRPYLALAPNNSALRAFISDGDEPLMPGAWFLTDQEVAHLAEYVHSLGAVPPEKIPGDPIKGARVYEKYHCSQCHTFDGKGSGFGPDLTNIAEERSASFIRKTILNPASSLPPDFLLVQVTDSVGHSIEGIRLDEDTFSIQIKDSSGRPFSFLKWDLKSLRKLTAETPMPSFAPELSASDLDDLVSFLMGQKTE